jgi:hypothetical protein
VIRGYLMMPLQLYLQRRYAGVPTAPYLAGLRGPVLAVGSMAAVVLAARWLMGPDVGPLVLLLVSVLVGIASYGAAILLLDRDLVKDSASVLSQALPGGERLSRRLGRRSRARRGEPSTDPARPPGVLPGPDADPSERIDL